MKVVLTNLSNSLYEDSRFKLNKSAIAYNIKNVRSYDFGDITSTDFYRQNKKILDSPKGLGYWLWKPYIILEAMKTLAENDIVIYADCGIEIVADLTPLIKICMEDESILLFGNGNYTNSQWTKRDCFVLMDCDSENYWFANQCDAAFALFKKSEKSINFLNDWLKYGSDERIITDNSNTCGLPNFAEFSEHRRDQSIMSLLAVRYKINLYRMPTQFGNFYKPYLPRVAGEFKCIDQARRIPVNHYAVIPYYNSSYPQLLNHHRENAEISIDTTKKMKLSRLFTSKIEFELVSLFKKFGYDLKKSNG